MRSVDDKEIDKRSRSYCRIEKYSHKKKGVYNVGVSGPTYETPAEYRMFHILGGDCVGMSTVPEVIVARHAAMKCVGFSVITDMWRSQNTQEVSHEDVLLQAAKAEPFLSAIIKELVLKI